MIVRFVPFWIAATLLSAGPAGATLLMVSNPGFEDPILTEPASTDDDVPGWIGTGGVLGASNFGVFNPPSSFFPAEAPEGENVAYIQDGQIAQGLADVLTEGTYELSVLAGQSLVDSLSPFRVQLWAGPTLLAEETTPMAVAGEFVDVTVQYVAGAADPALGSALEIVLVDDGIPGNSADEPYFDSVSLDFVPTPEPAQALLLLIGAACLTVGRRVLLGLTGARRLASPTRSSGQ